MDSGEQRSATPGMKTGLATQTAQKDQFRTRIEMTAAVQFVGKQRNSWTDIVELNALRCEIQQLQECDNDASASLAYFRRVQNETCDARIRKCKIGRSSSPPRGAGDALAGLGAGARAQKGAAQQFPMLSWRCTSNIF